MHISAETIQTAKYLFSFDENSTEFKQAFEDYNEMIANGEYEDMMEHIAYNLTRRDKVDEMVEGVGYLAPLNGKPYGEPWSGVYVEVAYTDEWDFELKTLKPQQS